MGVVKGQPVNRKAIGARAPHAQQVGIANWVKTVLGGKRARSSGGRVIIRIAKEEAVRVGKAVIKTRVHRVIRLSGGPVLLIVVRAQAVNRSGIQARQGCTDAVNPACWDAIAGK